MSWQAIAGFRLVTQHPERAARFYAALGFEIDDAKPIDPADIALLGLDGDGTRRRMRRGTVAVDLDRYDDAGAPFPAKFGANSIAFQHLALTSVDIAGDWLAACSAGASAISLDAPVALPCASGGVTAVKFRDPDGHPLELIAFPDHGRHEGIDHSAIVTRNVTASVAFYTAMGLSVGDRTLNTGITQDRLDGLAGAVVDVVPLLPGAEAPHLELLGYRSPARGGDSAAAINDVAATRVLWQADRTGLARDPDGHWHELRADQAPRSIA